MSLTTAQKKYFKDSKLLTDDNQLQVFYHATEAKFDAFDKKFIGDGHGSSFGEGFYFSAEPIPAYGDNLAVYLNVKKPYVLDLNNNDNLEDFANKLNIDYSEMKEFIRFYCSVKGGIGKTLREYCVEDLQPLKDKGFDGIIILNTSVGLYNQPKQEISKEVLVFEPNQIKSVNNLYPTKSDNFIDNKKEYMRNKRNLER